jgi:hypothetical protein
VEGDGKDTSKAEEQAAVSAPKAPTELDGLLADLKKGMTEAELVNAIKGRGLIGLPITISISDPNKHLRFVGADPGPVTFVFDDNKRLVSWKRW